MAQVATCLGMLNTFPAEVLFSIGKVSTYEIGSHLNEGNGNCRQEPFEIAVGARGDPAQDDSDQTADDRDYADHQAGKNDNQAQIIGAMRKIETDKGYRNAHDD